MHAVRKHILEILKEREGATVAELAEVLEMAPVSVRHHLDLLQGDNLICVDRLERKGNVGRPQQIYALTPDANEFFPDNFAALALGLVRQLKRVLPPDQVEAAFCDLAHDFAGKLEPQLAELDTERRLDRGGRRFSMSVATWRVGNATRTTRPADICCTNATAPMPGYPIDTASFV